MAERDEASLADLEARIRALGAELTLLHRRVRKLEDGLGAAPGVVEPAHVLDEEDVAVVHTPEEEFVASTTVIALIGRTFLVLAGAFLLRALTDSGVLAPTVGVAAALLYGSALLPLAYADARRGRRESATFLTLSAALITFPVVLEASTKLHVLTPSLAAIILAAESVLGTAVAAAGRLRVAAWTFTLGTLGTGFVLRIATGAEAVFIGAVLVVGLLTVLIAYGRDWKGPRWVVAGAANLAVLELAFSTARTIEHAAPGAAPSPLAALSLSAALVFVYLGSIGVWTLVRRRDVAPFEILQSCAALAVGLLSAWLLFHASELPGVGLGLPVTITAAGCYAIAFAFIRRRHGRGRNFFFYSALGALLTLVGLPLLVPAGVLPIVFGSVAVIGAFVGGHYDRITLRSHAAAFAAVALAVAGLAWFEWTAFFGRTLTPTSPGLAAAMALTLLAYVVLLGTERGREISTARRIPRFLIGTLALSSLVAQLVMWSASGAGASNGAAHAVIATAAISAVAVGVAAVAGRPAFRELAWLTYPLLIVGAAKLLLGDLRVGNAGTLFVGFACYGAALILAPRLLHGTRRRTTPA